MINVVREATPADYQAASVKVKRRKEANKVRKSHQLLTAASCQKFLGKQFILAIYVTHLA
jgi:hypothetical protein